MKKKWHEVRPLGQIQTEDVRFTQNWLPPTKPPDFGKVIKVLFALVGSFRAPVLHPPSSPKHTRSLQLHQIIRGSFCFLQLFFFFFGSNTPNQLEAHWLHKTKQRKRQSLTCCENWHWTRKHKHWSKAKLWINSSTAHSLRYYYSILVLPLQDLLLPIKSHSDLKPLQFFFKSDVLENDQNWNEKPAICRRSFSEMFAGMTLVSLQHGLYPCLFMAEHKQTSSILLSNFIKVLFWGH